MHKLIQTIFLDKKRREEHQQRFPSPNRDHGLRLNDACLPFFEFIFCLSMMKNNGLRLVGDGFFKRCLY